MRTTFVVAVLLAGLVLAGGAAAEQPGSPLEGDRATFTAVDDGNETNESVGFGSSVSSFVQSTTAQTNTAVGQGVWEASVEGNATAEEAQSRAAQLGERVAELRAQRARLVELRENGSISLPTYLARDARLRAELRSLGAAANDTQQVAPNDTDVRQSLLSVEQAAEAAQGPPDEIANRTGAPADVPGIGAGNGTGPGETPANASEGGGPPANTSNAGEPPAGAFGNAPNGTGNSTDGAGGGAGDGAGGSGGSGGDSSGAGSDAGGSSSDGAGSNGSGSNGSGSNSGSSTGADTGGTGDAVGG